MEPMPTVEIEIHRAADGAELLIHCLTSHRVLMREKVDDQSGLRAGVYEVKRARKYWRVGDVSIGKQIVFVDNERTLMRSGDLLDQFTLLMDEDKVARLAITNPIKRKHGQGTSKE